MAQTQNGSQRHPLDQDGLLGLFGWIFKNKDRFEAEAKLEGDKPDRGKPVLVPFPDTIVYEHHFPRGWYIYDATGAIVKKSAKECDTKSILKAFASPIKISKEDSNKRGSLPPKEEFRKNGVEASFSWRDEATEEIRTTYLNHGQLETFLLKPREKGILQKFVLPAGKHNDGMRVTWTPFLFVAERWKNNNALDDQRLSVNDRAQVQSVVHCHEVCCAPNIVQLCKDFCQMFCSLMWKIEKKVITKMTLDFKLDKQSKICLLRARQICLTEDPQVLARKEVKEKVDGLKIQDPAVMDRLRLVPLKNAPRIALSKRKRKGQNHTNPEDEVDSDRDTNTNRGASPKHPFPLADSMEDTCSSGGSDHSDWEGEHSVSFQESSLRDSHEQPLPVLTKTPEEKRREKRQSRLHERMRVLAGKSAQAKAVANKANDEEGASPEKGGKEQKQADSFSPAASSPTKALTPKSKAKAAAAAAAEPENQGPSVLFTPMSYVQNGSASTRDLNAKAAAVYRGLKPRRGKAAVALHSAVSEGEGKGDALAPWRKGGAKGRGASNTYKQIKGFYDAARGDTFVDRGLINMAIDMGIQVDTAQVNVKHSPSDESNAFLALRASSSIDWSMPERANQDQVSIEREARRKRDKRRARHLSTEEARTYYWLLHLETEMADTFRDLDYIAYSHALESNDPFEFTLPYEIPEGALPVFQMYNVLQRDHPEVKAILNPEPPVEPTGSNGKGQPPTERKASGTEAPPTPYLKNLDWVLMNTRGETRGVTVTGVMTALQEAVLEAIVGQIRNVLGPYKPRPAKPLPLSQLRSGSIISSQATPGSRSPSFAGSPAFASRKNSHAHAISSGSTFLQLPTLESDGEDDDEVLEDGTSAYFYALSNRTITPASPSPIHKHSWRPLKSHLSEADFAKKRRATRI